MIPPFEYPQGATPIDPDEEEGLLLTHVTTRGELDRWEQENIGGPWYQIPTALRNLLNDVALWLELHEEPYDEKAVVFHHRLVSIHPFPNGNGRHARLMTDVLLENGMGRPRFTWGRGNLSKAGEIRLEYIAALQAADRQDYAPLHRLVRT